MSRVSVSEFSGIRGALDGRALEEHSVEIGPVPAATERFGTRTQSVLVVSNVPCSIALNSEARPGYGLLPAGVERLMLVKGGDRLSVVASGAPADDVGQVAALAAAVATLLAGFTNPQALDKKIAELRAVALDVTKQREACKAELAGAESSMASAQAAIEVSERIKKGVAGEVSALMVQQQAHSADVAILANEQIKLDGDKKEFERNKLEYGKQLADSNRMVEANLARRIESLTAREAELAGLLASAKQASIEADAARDAANTARAEILAVLAKHSA